ncbi:MAG: 6-phosphogluconolactonase [Halioglobus sp.]
MNSHWQNYPDTDQLDRELAAHIAGLLKEDLELSGKASLAVSGGSTPKGLFRCLSDYRLDWANVGITLVDERWVDRSSPDSNEQLMLDKLIQGEAKSARVIGLKTAHASAEEGLAEARQRIADMHQPFSAVILGMGGDGHTASWFPQSANLSALLDPSGVDQVAVTDPVTAPHQRITLTLPAVLNSREIIVHITTRKKRAVLESASQNQFPIATILEQTVTPISIWWAP